jgi:hypothetical protein
VSTGLQPTCLTIQADLHGIETTPQIMVVASVLPSPSFELVR